MRDDGGTTAMSGEDLETCRALVNSEGDALYTRIDIQYDLLDRLRLLVRGRCTVYVRVPTLQPIIGHGQAEVNITVKPLWLWWLWRGCATTPQNDPMNPVTVISTGDHTITHRRLDRLSRFSTALARWVRNR